MFAIFVFFCLLHGIALDWIEYAPSILRTGGDGQGTDYLA